jgi:hypothetical protein
MQQVEAFIYGTVRVLIKIHFQTILKVRLDGFDIFTLIYWKSNILVMQIKLFNTYLYVHQHETDQLNVISTPYPSRILGIIPPDSSCETCGNYNFPCMDYVIFICLLPVNSNLVLVIYITPIVTLVILLIYDHTRLTPLH